LKISAKSEYISHITSQLVCKFKNDKPDTNVKMARKLGSPRQQSIFKCTLCGYTSKKHGPLVLHAKEAHDVEL